MSEPSQPPLSLTDTDVSAPDAGLFRWPTPPYACYPQPEPQTDHEPCEIVGLNGRLMRGRLVFFVPDEQVAQVQVPPSRTTMPLRFGQFRSLLLTRPFAASVTSPEVDPHAAVMDQRMNTEYRVWLKDGSQLRGHTMGHAQMPFGLFLFPPLDADGNVNRLFIPAEVIDRVQFGPRIGEVLVEHQAATPSIRRYRLA